MYKSDSYQYIEYSYNTNILSFLTDLKMGLQTFNKEEGNT